VHTLSQGVVVDDDAHLGWLLATLRGLNVDLDGEGSGPQLHDRRAAGIQGHSNCCWALACSLVSTTVPASRPVRRV